MIQRFGIDTPIFLRLLTGDPPRSFDHCVRALTRLVERDQAEVVVSNQVIGETYIVLQHHYGVAKRDARTAIATVLRSGLVAPLNGAGVFAALAAEGGCGLIDRLIADDYRRLEIETLTLDGRMARLPSVRKL